MDFKISFICKTCKRDAIIRRSFEFDYVAGIFVPDIVHIGCKSCGHVLRTKLEIWGLATWHDDVMDVFYEMV